MNSPKASGTQGPLYDEVGKLVACSRARYDFWQWNERVIDVLNATLGQRRPSRYGTSVVLGEDAEGGGRGGWGGCNWDVWLFREMGGVRGDGDDVVCHGGCG